MALGDIKEGPFDLIYRAKGAGTITAGIIIAFDANGLAIPATATTYGRHGILTAMTHVVGATTYYGILMRGKVIAEAGAAIKPNAPVESDANGDVITAPTTISAGYTQAEIQVLWRVFGRYIRKDGDNQYAPSDAAATDAIVIDVGDH